MAVVAATVVAGCGGDDDSGFVAATNQTCEAVTAAAKTLETALVRGPGKSETDAVRTAVRRYVAAVSAAADTLEAAKPSKAEREFQRQAVAHLRGYATDLRAAADGDDGARTAAERLIGAEGSAAPLVPPAVLAGAPACAEGAAR